MRSVFCRIAVAFAMAAFFPPPAAEAASVFNWQTLPNLPRPVSGQYVGVSGNALIVAGGSYFPVSVFEGGTKKWVDTVYVLESGAGEWKEFRLARPLAYGGAVSTKDGVILIGGGDSERNYADVFRLQWNGRTLLRTDLPPLPAPAANLSATLLGGTIYVAGGQSEPVAAEALRRFWSLTPADQQAGWRELEPWPGPGRIFPVLAAQEDSIYLVSGAELVKSEGGAVARRYLTDGYRYRPGSGWSPIPAIPRAAVAAPAMGYGQAHILVFGGDDGEHAARVQELKDRHPGFRRDILAFHTITQTWTTLGEVTPALVTTGAARFGDAVVIAGGEDRPGHRNATVLAGTAAESRARIGAFDYTVLGVYLSAIVLVGIWFTRRNRNTDDFFLASRRVPWWAAGLSIYSTQLSSITFMAIPAKAYATDWTYVLVNVCILAVAPVVVLVYMPFFHRLNVTTAYEYLEKRFNRTVRLYSSALFMLFQLGRLAIVLFLPAIALATVSDTSVYVCILLMGGLAIVYTMLGGIEAVIWTEVVQSVVLLGGAFLCFWLAISGTSGGWSEFWSVGNADGKFHIFDWNWDLTVATAWVLLIGNLASVFATYTSDQTIIQKYLTTANEKQAARSIWTNTLLTVPSTLLFFGIGTALYSYYKSNPASLNPHLATDGIFPWFIVQNLPAGVAGLVLAALFAAAQSTLSSSMHSLSTAFIVDFYRPARASSEGGRLRIARVMTCAFGVFGTATALLMATYDIRSLFDVFLGLLSMFAGGLAGIFILGVFTERATAWGALCGGIASAFFVILVRVYTPIHFFLYAAIGLVSCCVLGYLFSLFMPASGKDLTGLVLSRAEWKKGA